MITHVAILRNGIVYSLPEPNRHHHIFHIMPDNGNKEDDVQGFVDEEGRFLNRVEAYKVAVETKQIRRRPGGYDGPLLFSEDLW